MSGGAYNYLMRKDAGELMSSQKDLEDMAQRLAGLGYAEDAAREAEELLCIIRQALVRVEVRQKRLYSVFRMVEWWDSGDTGEDGVQRALTAYRGGEPMDYSKERR